MAVEKRQRRRSVEAAATVGQLGARGSKRLVGARRRGGLKCWSALRREPLLRRRHWAALRARLATKCLRLSVGSVEGLFV